MIYFVYSLFTLSVALFFSRCDEKTKVFIYFSIVLVISFVIGFRIPEVGTDTISYINIFSYPGNYREPLFSEFILLLKSFGMTSEYFIFLMTFLNVAILHYAGYKWNNRNILILLYFFSSTYVLYSFSLNIMRQGIAISISILSAYLVYRKKYLASIFLCLMALVFHSTAVFYMPAVAFVSLLGRDHFPKKIIIFLLALLIGFYVFPAVNILEPIVRGYFSGQRILITVLNYLKQIEANPWLTFSSIFAILLYFSYWLLCHKVQFSNKLHFLLNYYFVGFVSCTPFVYIHLVYYRLAWYFFALEPIIILSLISELWPRFHHVDRKIKYIISFLIVVLPFLYLFKTYYITGGIMREVSFDTIIF
ncbi:EpsG family protein [Vibrio alginolyticus]|uniref:EpsG family protein n=1 Tax=Vibrio alginolyticus TaxID=663 RepID=UPI00215FF6F2|nr:EpsG family protein [Vibrio alginolyticus]MCS0130064.1 EpsG family protein [Vibrio alginolyticus]MCS0157118.1 EpsG family protein [Vibrio alginolyticus]HBN6276129.1 EpsG family protein [Vibrio parahaemolyticus]HBN6312890.1 EpsG family protein [Vibrio parahaemolyticus]